MDSNSARLGRCRRIVVAGLTLLVISTLSACGYLDRELPEFGRAPVAADALPSAFHDSVDSMELDLESSRLLGEDSRGYGYYVVKGVTDSSLTQQCLVYFVGSDTSGIVCSTNLPISVSAAGLGSATLYFLPRSASGPSGGEWVGEHLHLEPDAVP